MYAILFQTVLVQFVFERNGELIGINFHLFMQKEGLINNRSAHH